jgi:ketosteroid isomerase-like protein
MSADLEEKDDRIMSELFDKFSAAYKALEQRPGKPGDTSLMYDLFAEDIVFTSPERTLHGRDQAIARFTANQKAFSELTLNVDYDTMVIDAGHACCVEFVISGVFTGDLDTSISVNDGELDDSVAPTGKSFSIRTTDHVWWKDGKIYRFNVYYDPAEMTRQLV